MSDDHRTDGGRSTPALGVVDRALYALFSRYTERRRHDADRKRYRGTTIATTFDVYISRVYGASWAAFLLVGALAFVAAVALDVTAISDAVAGRFGGVSSMLPDPIPAFRLGRTQRAALAGLTGGLAAKHATVRLGGRYLAWSVRIRRSNIERTLPGAVRYLRALAAGSDDERAMLRKVAERDGAYGETAVEFRKVLNRAALTGSLGTAIRVVARDTPSRDALAPFLLKFREHAEQGVDAVEGYLTLESRMLSHRQTRVREQAQGFLELLAELFIVLLVLPALLAIVLTVLSVLAPGLTAPVRTPLGTVSVRGLLLYGSAGFVLATGVAAAALVTTIRPPGYAGASYGRSESVVEGLKTAPTNPADAAMVFPVLGVAVGLLAWRFGHRPVNVVLFSYAAYALPVGLVAVRRARRDDAKDREIQDFVHAVSSHVSLGRPFPRAVELVARDVDLGPLQPDVTDLAFNLRLSTRDEDLRGAALGRFVDDVGTPLAEQTIGLVTGALDVGSDTEAVFETLQAEIGRLYHEKKALRATLMVYVAVGWTTALLVVGIMVAVNVYVLDSFAQLSAVSQSTSSVALNPGAVDPSRDRYRFYVITQATMLASGWFAGYASRGRYDALLHSGVLVVFAYVVFTGANLL